MAVYSVTQMNDDLGLFLVIPVSLANATLNFNGNTSQKPSRTCATET